MMFCICGVCIPVSLLWPLLLLAVKPIYDFLAGYFGWQPLQATKSKTMKGGECTSDGCCNLATGECGPDNDTGKPVAEKSGTGRSAGDSNYITLQSNDASPSLDEIISSAGPNVTYLKFTASWCRPCKEIEPTFAALAKEYSDTGALFVTVDVDEFDEEAVKYGASSIPLFIAVKKGGEEVGRMTGKDAAQLRQLVQKHSSKIM